MTVHSLAPDVFEQLSTVLSGSMGLYFPEENKRDLERGLSRACDAFGFSSVEQLADWTVSGALPREQVERLASYLTIGETYFFRERAAFTVLGETIVPQLVERSESGAAHIRFWSAGCCTGEEAYTIAILVDMLRERIGGLNASIFATDINPHFLEKASRGIYGEWSFRGVPSWIRDKYFEQLSPGAFRIHPRIAARVAFSYLNLVEDSYPSLTSGINALDVIFCRNVLMYFHDTTRAAVIRRLWRALRVGGWLIVGASELSQHLYTDFDQRSFGDVIAYQKKSETTSDAQSAAALYAPTVAFETAQSTAVQRRPKHESSHRNAAPRTMSQPGAARHTSDEIAARLKHLSTNGKYADLVSEFSVATDAVQRRCIDSHPELTAALARAFASTGNLTEANRWCEHGLRQQKMNPVLHYLHANILLEGGAVDDAEAALNRALYLDHDFLLALFTLGNIRRRRKNYADAAKHYRRIAFLLESMRDDEVIQESDGLTAARMKQMIAAFLEAPSS